MLQNISLAKADTYFVQAKLTDYHTTLGPIGPPPPDNKNLLRQYAKWAVSVSRRDEINLPLRS